MDITILTKDERAIHARDVRRLYDGAGWWPGWDNDGIAIAIDASLAIGAWDGERLVGFTRALSDGVHRAYIEDVVVHPDYRGQEIGERIVAALVGLLADVHVVSLFCEPERVNFYKRNRFMPSASQVMMHREPQVVGEVAGSLDRAVG